jgi:hypothetical protein
MSQNPDAESSPKPSDERTPLLRREDDDEDEQASEATLLADGQRSPGSQHEEAALLEPPRQPRTKSWYIWRLFWFVVVALVLAFFIKGWIEADDVDVRDFYLLT